MCGRFTLRTPASEIADLFELADMPALPPRYNIAPTQSVAAVRQVRADQPRQLEFLHWGLIPSWADDPKIGNRMINARAETAATKPAFRQAFRSRRCLIPCDGFYEWRREGTRKQPYYVRLKTDTPFAFAGLWENWRRGSEAIESCTILTTDANEAMRAVHDRMPVILPENAYDQWLDPKFHDPEALQALLQPYPGELLEIFPVAPVVNSPRNDTAECIRPA